MGLHVNCGLCSALILFRSCDERKVEVVGGGFSVKAEGANEIESSFGGWGTEFECAVLPGGKQRADDIMIVTIYGKWRCVHRESTRTALPV